MSYTELTIEARRGNVLKELAWVGIEAVNEVLLYKILTGMGHRISSDALRVDLAWLEEQGLVEIEDLAGVYLTTITQRGEDAAKGLVTVPGLKHVKRGR